MELNTEERLAWWHEARYGMFIHWGLYASLAGVWKGRKTTNIAEWIMRDLHIPVADYERIAETFNPVKYDAEAWAQLAEDAGMKYVVITAKHHDGFCMFAAETNPYNIVKCTPFGRDPGKRPPGRHFSLARAEAYGMLAISYQCIRNRRYLE